MGPLMAVLNFRALQTRKRPRCLPREAAGPSRPERKPEPKLLPRAVGTWSQERVKNPRIVAATSAQ